MISLKVFDRTRVQEPILFTPISKTVKQENGEIVAGIDVKTHCLICGYVAQKLIEIYPENIRNFLFPQGTALIAACHDIGKISPAFQKMIYSSISNPDTTAISNLSGANADASGRREYAFHAKVTQTVLSDKPRYIPEIEGMHHGFRPNNSPCTEAVYGGADWTEKRHELLSFLEKQFLLPEQTWPIFHDWNLASVLGGFITVADWIASGGKFAEMTQNTPVTDEQLKQMASNAVAQAGFVPFQVRQNLSFFDIFNFSPYPVQSSFFESVTEPGIYIMEAPMGIGKTEAALYAAYCILSAGKATGLYFGLPTQLTSNKIYERVRQYFKKITDTDASLKLLHSSAWLEETTLGEDGDIGRSWFDSSKRGILAPFAVGTVDQALMAVMNVRHGMVRAFGLAGKVVILDEVHSYDAYTGTILNSLVQCLREIGCTVLILSATLTASQKNNLLACKNAWHFSDAYPLITTTSSKNDMAQLHEISEKPEKGHTVTVSFRSGCADALEIALEKAEKGQQVLWIENTVDEAQKVYRQAAARTTGTVVECGLIHSRFIRKRRTENEAYWVSLYGTNGHNRRTEHGRILVGTQVLEQSLDIDADFLITRLCPTDMLLQRIGRLWRHSVNNNIRPEGSSCSVLIIAPAYADVVEKQNIFGVSTAVYSEYVLCRTLEIWENMQTLRLPEDIRNLLERTYCVREESGRLRKLKDEMLAVKNRLEGFARITQSTAVQTFSESEVQTRYSDLESCKTLLILSFVKTKTGYALSFPNEDNVLELPQNTAVLTPKTKRHIARVLEENCVIVAEKNAPPYDRMIQIFSAYIYTGSQEDNEHPFRAAIIGHDEYLLGIRNDMLKNDDKRFLYNAILGYQIL